MAKVKTQRGAGKAERGGKGFDAGNLSPAVKAAAAAKAAALEVKPSADASEEAKRLLLEAVDLVDRAKEMFEQADKRIDVLVRTLGVGNVVVIDDGRSAFLVDCFADSNVVWRSHANRRYQVTVVKRSKPPT